MGVFAPYRARVKALLILIKNPLERLHTVCRIKLKIDNNHYYSQQSFLDSAIF